VASAEELIRAIDAVTDRTAVTTGPSRALPMTTSPPVTTLSGSSAASMSIPRSERRRWPIAALAVSLAALTIVTVTLVTRHRDDALVAASHLAEPPSVPVLAQSPPASAPAASEPPASGPPATSPADPVQSTPLSPTGEPATPPPSEGRPAAAAPIDPPPLSAAPADTIGIAIDSAPPGAQIVLDGAVLGTTPYRGTLPRGDREARLVLRLTGYADKVVVARASQSIAERVTLVRKAAPATGRSKTDRDQSINPF